MDEDPAPPGQIFLFNMTYWLYGHSSTEVSETTEISINPIRVTAGFLETF